MNSWCKNVHHSAKSYVNDSRNKMLNTWIFVCWEKRCSGILTLKKIIQIEGNLIFAFAGDKSVGEVHTKIRISNQQGKALLFLPTFVSLVLV